MDKTKKLWLLWGLAYGICTVCGFIPVTQGALTGLFLLLSLGFFVPPGFLLYEAARKKDRKLFRSIRNLSILSLSLTLVMILLNFVAVQASQVWGLVLYWLLILVSVPMVCSQAWVVGLFGWACLLMTSLTGLQKKIT